MTYGEWFDTYMRLYKRSLADKTRESYARLHKLLTPLHGVQLDQLTPDQLQCALIGVEEAAGSRQAQLAYTLLHGCLRRAVRSRHLEYNPADALDKPEHDAEPGRAITDAEWEQLLPAISSEVGLALMAFAGLRRGEALGLRRGDVDQAAGLIHVRRQRLRISGQLRTVPPKSAAAVRDVPLEADLDAVLRELPLMLPNAYLVQIAPETLARRWRRAQDRAQIRQPYRLHDLRHTYATHMVRDGVNVRILQYMVGHATLDITMQTYTHIDGAAALAEVSRKRQLLH